MGETVAIEDERRAIWLRHNIAKLSKAGVLELLEIERKDGLQAVYKMAEQISRLTEENESLRKASEWQPIETAPKNDTTFILGWDSYVAMGTGAHFVMNFAGGQWRAYPSWIKAQPSHWRPLPEPPTDIARSALGDGQ